MVAFHARVLAGEEKRRDEALRQLEVQRRAMNQLRRGEILGVQYQAVTALTSLDVFLVDSLTQEVRKWLRSVKPPQP
jgi:hypothetical protein